MTPAERRLTQQARAELAALAYPDRSWVRPVSYNGQPCLDVLIIGGGQSGLAIAHGLRRDHVTNIAILDARPAGQEGVWEHFARMSELRTLKQQNGIEFGQPSLSLRAWYQARFGTESWQALTRIPRQHWMAYLRWYRQTLDLPVENNVTVTDIRPGPAAGLVTVETSSGTRLARSVVLATGFEGGSVLRLPEVITPSLPPDRYDHACTPIDFTRFQGKRIGILGHGASAFDAAVVALQSGAQSVDLCFRRTALPVVNPHRHLDAPGLMAHWPALNDQTRWNIARHMRQFDQPPGVSSFHAAIKLSGFRMHPDSPWQTISLDGSTICVTTPHRQFHFDHLISATG
jgi:cation diffusion facilitator CzcD-associated flavoprotein CzcO